MDDERVRSTLTVATKDPDRIVRHTAEEELEDRDDD